jgi:hypothetical protein
MRFVSTSVHLSRALTRTGSGLEETGLPAGLTMIIEDHTRACVYIPHDRGRVFLVFDSMQTFGAGASMVVHPSRASAVAHLAAAGSPSQRMQAAFFVAARTRRRDVRRAAVVLGLKFGPDGRHLRESEQVQEVRYEEHFRQMERGRADAEQVEAHHVEPDTNMTSPEVASGGCCSGPQGPGRIACRTVGGALPVRGASAEAIPTALPPEAGRYGEPVRGTPERDIGAPVSANRA